MDKINATDTKKIETLIQINWKQIDQLHDAVTLFSKTSFEIKKLLVVIIGILLPFINKIEKEMPFNLYIVIFIISIFWLLDSITYYYQEKLRWIIDKKTTKILSLSSIDNLNREYNKNDFISLSKYRQKYRLVRSVFNPSSLIFYLGLILFLLLIYYTYFSEI